MRAHRWLAWGLLAAGVAAGAAWAEQERERAGVGRQVRASLRPQMKEHGPHMEELVWTVVLLQRDQTRVLSASIAASEKLARTAESLERIVAGNEAALSGLAGPGAVELQQLVLDVRDASAEIRALARSLRENPSSLLRESKEQGVEIAK